MVRPVELGRKMRLVWLITSSGASGGVEGLAAIGFAAGRRCGRLPSLSAGEVSVSVLPSRLGHQVQGLAGGGLDIADQAGTPPPGLPQG